MRQVPRPLDYSAAQEAVRVIVNMAPDGSETREVVGGAEVRMQFALLARAITAWSFDGVPVPSQNIAKPDEVLDSVFTDPDDWDAVCEAVQPLLERVNNRRGTPKPAEKTAEAPIQPGS